MISEIKEARRKARELLKPASHFEDVYIMFQDEARFGRINETRSCWVKGARPIVQCQIVREYTYAYVSICPFDGTMDSLVLPWSSSKVMQIYLDEISSRHSDKFILMFLDQAGWHREGELKVPENIRLALLPPYSPELNPTEHIFDELREKFFHNLAFDSMKAVEDRLVDGLYALENNKPLVQSTTRFSWIISCS
jgi:transposase